MRKKMLALLASGTFIFSSLGLFAQEEEAENYIPTTIERIVDQPSDGEQKTPIKEKVDKSTLANSIFLYEGYGKYKNVTSKSFFERYVENLEEELNKMSPLNIREDLKEIEYAENVPFETEMYSALGKTLIEKYKFFREVDRSFKKVRDATTIKLRSKDGTRYRIGPYVGRAEMGELGGFLKIKNGNIDLVFVGCENEMEVYVSTKLKGLRYKLSHNYKTGANGDERERQTYFSISK
jgi:hypothetical protein